ncbi:hypothetical protein VF04_26555 [Nostoc linckia z7]|jgi:hypothetical protein|uniref:Uncharacterized protein n=2 Tax=Nostoc linckia TaxID=92942 RepID=A0A9Q6EIH5_NOSLI|nr:hypothetical protein VF02_30620 [Nostoc linckia z1]PHJ57810.1 hypothetical protein VF05_35045 [Nostoc linckia z3]PHJ64263.1 hypothetical protein VF03_29315 [Nostoc linckia z2]PHJ76033.1 hypothetical protein VF06_32175 [Nostoc linckia z4]PHJ82755.1 hypothetical protein VF07_27855 [Nostoc linckia z6]PHJ93264.1 hypothetical protein VF04_26555 [Nostoc linckia z7]PHJ97441.1 hypothetical protein VF08_28780 [Nostoc linckia z8]PHK05878.1 hypothetical protein VF09_26180 [Nostoc linckia z9]
MPYFKARYNKLIILDPRKINTVRLKGKGERRKGKGFKYIQIPLPLNLFPDHKGSSYCLSEPYCQTNNREIQLLAWGFERYGS